MTYIYTDPHGVEWVVTSYSMTRLFRRRTPWRRFVAWLARAIGVGGRRGEFGGG